MLVNLTCFSFLCQSKCVNKMHKIYLKDGNLSRTVPIVPENLPFCLAKPSYAPEDYETVNTVRPIFR